jgi:putative nucleotidyltransferase with HDIG domain
MTNAESPSRQDALALLGEFNNSQSLLNHAAAVEAVMRCMARKAGQNEDEWGIAGLIHDLDYERFPEQHCHKAEEILRSRGWPELYIRAMMSHGWGICTEVAPESLLEKTLFAVDELVGFVTACALVRPSKSVTDLEVSSVRKKWKQKTFAAGANREIIQKGADMLGVPLEQLMADVIAGMREVASEIGL